jgi:hypothetical protein
VERITLRGALPESEAYAVVCDSRSRESQPTRCAHEAREGSTFRSCARTTERCAEQGSRRGLVSSKDGASLRSSQPGPAGTLARETVGSLNLRGSSARTGTTLHNGVATGRREGAKRVVPSERRTRNRRGSWSVPVHRTLLQKSFRTSPGSEKRVVGIGRVESLSGVPNRVNGSLIVGNLRRVSEGARRR